MADVILIDTQLLEQLSSQIMQVKNSLSNIGGNMSSSLSEVRRVAPDQPAIINKLVDANKKLGLTMDHAGKLARAISHAAELWEQTEQKISSMKLPETADQQNNPDSSGQGSPNGFPIHDVWSSGLQIIDFAALRMNPLFPLSAPIQAGIAAYGALSKPSVQKTIADIFTNNFSGSDSAFHMEGQSGGWFGSVDLFGYEYKSKGQANWTFKEGGKEADPKNGSIGISESVSVSAYFAKVKGGYRGKYGEYSNEFTVGGGSTKGELGATLFDKGKINPGLYIKGEAETYLIREKRSVRLGTEDVNVHASGEETLFGAKADGKAGFNLQEGVFAKAGAEAYVAKGEIKGGIDLFGVKVDLTGEAMYGVNATAGAEVGPKAAEGELGLGPVKVKLNVDWSGLTQRLFS